MEEDDAFVPATYQPPGDSPYSGRAHNSSGFPAAEAGNYSSGGAGSPSQYGTQLQHRPAAAAAASGIAAASPFSHQHHHQLHNTSPGRYNTNSNVPFADSSSTTTHNVLGGSTSNSNANLSFRNNRDLYGNNAQDSVSAGGQYNNREFGPGSGSGRNIWAESSGPAPPPRGLSPGRSDSGYSASGSGVGVGTPSSRTGGVAAGVTSGASPLQRRPLLAKSVAQSSPALVFRHRGEPGTCK